MAQPLKKGLAAFQKYAKILKESINILPVLCSFVYFDREVCPVVELKWETEKWLVHRRNLHTLQFRVIIAKDSLSNLVGEFHLATTENK